jgi:hypothetical protein
MPSNSWVNYWWEMGFAKVSEFTAILVRLPARKYNKIVKIIFYQSTSIHIKPRISPLRMEVVNARNNNASSG